MTENKNPFLKPYNTPHDTAPFHLIKIEHYEPALLEGMKEQNEEIDAIVNNPEAPTFQNTIVALENSGALLDRVTTVFGNLMSAETSDEMQELAEKMMPLLSEHSNNISLNEKLFARIKTVYEQKDQLQLKGEDAQLLQKTYDSFVRSGANLTGEAKEKFRQLNTELSILTLRFSQNLLKETNNYELALTKKQLEGLPESSLESYAQTAKDKGKEGSIITLDAPSFVPFMKYCDDRSLRREVYMAYNTQCTHNNDYNNVDIIKQLVNIRMELAHLLGFSTFAEYKLKKRMAETSDAVYKLLNQLLEAYTPAALKEVAEVEAKHDGVTGGMTRLGYGLGVFDACRKEGIEGQAFETYLKSITDNGEDEDRYHIPIDLILAETIQHAVGKKDGDGHLEQKPQAGRVDSPPDQHDEAGEDHEGE